MKCYRIFLIFCSFIFYFCYFTNGFQVLNKKLSYEIDMKSNICFVKEFIDYKLDKSDLNIDEKKHQFIILKKILPKLNLKEEFNERLKFKNSFYNNNKDFHNNNNLILRSQDNNDPTNMNNENNLNKNSNLNLNEKKDKLIFNNFNIMIDFFTFDKKALELSKEDYFIKNFTLIKSEEKDSNKSNILLKNNTYTYINNTIENNLNNIINTFKKIKNKTKINFNNISSEEELKIYDLIIANENQKIKLIEDQIITLVYEYEIHNFLSNKLEILKNDSFKIKNIKNSTLDYFKNQNLSTGKNYSFKSENKIDLYNKTKEKIEFKYNMSNFNQTNFEIYKNISNNFKFDPKKLFGNLLVIDENELGDNKNHYENKNTNIIKKPPFEEIKIYINNIEKELNYGNIFLPDFVDYDLYEGYYVLTNNRVQSNKYQNSNINKRDSSIQMIENNDKRNKFMIEIKGRHINNIPNEELNKENCFKSERENKFLKRTFNSENKKDIQKFKLHKYIFALGDLNKETIENINSRKKLETHDTNIKPKGNKNKNNNNNNSKNNAYNNDHNKIRYVRVKKSSSNSGWESFIALLYVVCLCFLCVQCYESCSGVKNAEGDHNYLMNHNMNGNANGNDDFIYICN